MIISKNKEKSIFCIEGDWDDDLKNKLSISSALRFLEDSSSGNINCIHKNCTTKEEFVKRINEFIQPQYKEHSILYLAFHGEPFSIIVGESNIDLDEIADQFENKLTNKIIHFGSCSTLNVHVSHIKRFVRKTNALCVSGFKETVNFIPSTMFDIMYFEMCQRYKNITCIDREMKFYYKQLCKELKFTMIWNQ